ncbi:sugar phosphate nucleotidyltransferase [Pseudobutyrivibrio sp. LB2011]|uniref:sugar phosphate nucleotidyltransferase n=1 Tax=Pseudobutyrivibrio sp. LB2011 TaxID=1408312 RepID=UPI0005D24C00|nr:phosphocholine cytidylyltransferase family protein [Pseudobutyrivibrio sp. LB2011]
MKNKVERAIIMAAGLGNRMRPITDEIPKPLVKVNGTRMIDTVIDGLMKNGINDITIVVGYKKECFEALKDKYPDINLVENRYYDQYNNISSLYSVRDKLDRACIILDGDQLIYNDKILAPEFDLSGYSGAWVENDTDEWLMQEKDGVVTECSRTGGSKGWQLYSISRWTKDDALKLKKFVQLEFENDNRQIYWDDVPMFCHFKEFTLGINPISKEDLVEIDSFQDLVKLDNTYSKYTI